MPLLRKISDTILKIFRHNIRIFLIIILISNQEPATLTFNELIFDRQRKRPKFQNNLENKLDSVKNGPSIFKTNL